MHKTMIGKAEILEMQLYNTNRWSAFRIHCVIHETAFDARKHSFLKLIDVFDIGVFEVEMTERERRGITERVAAWQTVF